jgi:hypothetical protein
MLGYTHSLMRMDLLLRRHYFRFKIMKTKKTAFQRSKFGQINSVDVLNACYHGIVTTVPVVLGLFNIDKLPFIEDGLSAPHIVWFGFLTFFSAFFGDMIKRVNTNSNGESFAKE